LLGIAGAVCSALAPLPEVSVERAKLTLLEPLTSTAMLDRPLPEPSCPTAAREVNAMSWTWTKPLTLLTVSAGPPVVEVDVTVALPPT
jgi:hypothetical protein